MSKEEIIISKFAEIYKKVNILNNIEETKLLKDYTPSESHCVFSIGMIKDANVSKLAEEFKMTRGAISKITKKLLKKGAIESYQKPKNKKEIYFKLTDLGKEIFIEHSEIHKRWLMRDIEGIKPIEEEEKDTVIHFLDSFLKYLDKQFNSTND